MSKKELMLLLQTSKENLNKFLAQSKFIVVTDRLPHKILGDKKEIQKEFKKFRDQNLSIRALAGWKTKKTIA
jgi:hypothetical protein